jgi:hypothetical protein
MKSVTSILVFCVAVSASPALAQTLPEIARQQGGAAGRVIDIDSPIARPAELMSQSDLVIHGRVVDVTVRLNSDQSDVVTMYTIAPIQAFKQRRAASVAIPGAVSKILVQQYGGSLVTEDGLRLSTSVNVFPESECFTVGEEVVLFVTYRSNIGMYAFAAGEFGAYRIREGKVSPMTRDVAGRLQVQPVDASLFFRELQRLR